jgi:hypothetical protein
MKYFVYVLVITLCSLTGFSQDLLPEKDGKVVYEQIDSIPGTVKSELYSRAKIWLANIFKSAKDVIQLDDKETGQIIGKGVFFYQVKVLLTGAEWTCKFTVRIDVKDNKTRIMFYDISSASAASATAEHFNKYNKQSKQHIKAIDSNIKGLLLDFKTALTKKSNEF